MIFLPVQAKSRVANQRGKVQSLVLINKHPFMMHPHEKVTLARDVAAIQIPSGDTIVLPIGTEVYITQTLGGTYTVATEQGLARIAKEDADALNLKNGQPVEAESVEADSSLEDRVWAAMKTVYDPEIPVDVVNLGLIYDCILTEKDNGKYDALIKMTLTAPGCGMGPVIASDVEGRVGSLPEIESAHVELVWEPVWNQDMISEEGRMILGLV